MRRQGPYAAHTVADFETLVDDSTEERAVLLRPLVNNVSRTARAYDRRLPNVHLLKPLAVTQAERDALIDGYEGRTVAIKRRLAAMVESLPAANADLCPYCSLDQNPDLDHFLPKARFPEFSLHARNLIPICTPCNRKKLNAVKTQNGDRVLLNPAFEPTIDLPILAATVAYPGGQVAANYFLNDQGQLPPEERAVAQRHFDRLGLAGRYRARAHGYLASLKAGLAGTSDNVKTQTLNAKLQGAAFGKAINDWEPALMRAIGADVDAMLDWLSAP